MSLDIVRDSGEQQHREMPADSSIVSWVTTRVGEWEDHRRTNFDSKWDEYYRLWRGIWANEDKSRDTERSKIINPALSQAVEATVSELEEATFGQGKWFDASDNAGDEDPTDIGMWRDQLSEDLTKEDVESAISECYLNGALYGTGIGKIILNETTDKKVIPKAIGDTAIVKAAVEETPVVRVGLIAVHPKEFVIDPTARKIDEGLGCAHVTDVPKNSIQDKIDKGIYMDVTISGYTDGVLGSDRAQGEELKPVNEENKTQLIEYHGLVPTYLLERANMEEGEEIPEEEDETLVEAIVSIANGSTLLRATPNPYLMGDRCFISYQHDTVPNRFWGRGVCEKGYNPQKALDAESRGRIDAMALSIHPMMAMDATRIQRGSNFKVAPGRNVFTNGDPKDILMPFNFGQVNPSTFSQTSDLERQVQTGTGALDQATGPSGPSDARPGSMSMLASGSIKRSKRTLANIERQFTRPFIHKAAWRYMQFAPDRYPVQDITFNVHSTLGIMARELEQNQTANMFKTVPADSPAFWLLLKSFYELGNASNREEMLVVIDQMMKQSLQKQANPEPDPLVAIKMKEIEVEAQLEKAKLQQKADKDNKDLMIEIEKLKLEQQELQLKRQKILLDARVALAGQEQDSLVTAVQMQNSEQDSIRKTVVALSKNKSGSAS